METETVMSVFENKTERSCVAGFKASHPLIARLLVGFSRKVAVVIIGCAMVASVSQAAVDVGVNKSYDGTAPHSSTTPWVDTLFQDIGNNTVRLTITVPNLTSGNLANPEFLQSLFLNFNDTKQVTSLTFTPVFGLWQGLATASSVIESKNNEQASTGGKYDILLGFQAQGGVKNQFNQGDQVVYNITTTQAGTSLSSQDFAFLSTPGTAGSYYAAALIQNTGNNNKQSDYAGATSFTVLGVPEPASGLAAGACCLAGLVILRRRKASTTGPALA
jgi:hypothetical protein